MFQQTQMEVSSNRVTYKSSIYRWSFHYEPSILGYSHWWKPLYSFLSPVAQMAHPSDRLWPPDKDQPFDQLPPLLLFVTSVETRAGTLLFASLTGPKMVFFVLNKGTQLKLSKDIVQTTQTTQSLICAFLQNHGQMLVKCAGGIPNSMGLELDYQPTRVN